MSEYQRLIHTLQQYQSVAWINQYFDLLRRLLTDLGIEEGDPRLAMTLTKHRTLPVNLGQRYVLKPMPDQHIRCIVPADFEESAVDGVFIFPFTRTGVMDAKWIDVQYPLGGPFPQVLFYACVEACTDIVRQCRKSGFLKYHADLLYNFTMEPTVRNEILAELKTVPA